MNEVVLHGALGKQFGRSHKFSISSISEAIEALCANFPAFAGQIRNGFYRVVVGKTAKHGVEMDEETISGFNLGQRKLHIVPVTKGAGRSGLGKIIAGILLLGLVAVTGGTALMGTSILGGTTTVGGMVGSIGQGMLLTGVASFIAPQDDGEDKEKSFTMAGPQTTLREGGIVPIAYGEVITSGTMISGSLDITNTTPGSS